MKTFPIPSKPGGDDRERPKANDDDGAQSYAKGGSIQSASYAQGGAVLGRSRSFLKEVDPFRGTPASTPGTVVGPKVQKDVPQDYKGGKGPHKDKSKVSTPMPRK